MNHMLTVMETIETVNGAINNVVWGVPAMILILGVGLFLSIRTGFIQFSRFGYSMKHTVGTAFEKRERKAGAVSPFAAVCTALAATVGTGNIAGVAGAIAIGGPGAIFWMWISALLGMCTKFAEVTLSIRYRERNAKGDWVGGPMYYIKNGLGKNWKWLAVVFSIFGSLAAFGIGNATQVNTIASSINNALTSNGVTLSTIALAGRDVPISSVIIGVILAIIVAIVLIGGIQRIGDVCSLLVPFMAIIYIIGGLIVIFSNVTRIPGVFAAIFEGAFSPKAITGGIVGSMVLSMKKGVSRGIFSNEAGLGSAPIAHAAADVDHPVQQGLFGIFEVFADTIVICTMTALIILCGIGVNGITYGKAAGAELTVTGMSSVFGGGLSSIVLAICLSMFALSTVLTWGLYGSRCFEFQFGTKAIKLYQTLFVLVCIVGCTMSLEVAWGIADTLNGLMALPNLFALLLLSPVVVKLTREYFSKVGKKARA
ncbi:MAG: sodium:alanine symporter family protein [Oscillospiraceae bacterium]|nr:sodium:alanine symporter family protein [Oscillospiraceae bacterium]